MINEDALWYKRGDLVEFTLKLGGGPKTARGLVLNTAVLYGRGARQLWIVDVDNLSPEAQAHWKNKKHLVHEEDIISRLSTVLIGAETILRECPISYPVQDVGAPVEVPAVLISVPVPMPTMDQNATRT
jgi:hypothetical protein